MVVRVEELTERQRDLLDFERAWRFRYGGAKDAAIRDLFDCSPTRYYLELNALLDHPAAYAAEPVLIKRLRRLRDTRRQERSQPVA